MENIANNVYFVDIPLIMIIVVEQEQSDIFHIFKVWKF